MLKYSAGYEILWFVVNLCEALWALRIWQLGLVRVRPFLFAYLSVGLPLFCASFAIRWFGPDEVWAYRLFSSWTQPLYWTFTLLVLVETYNHVFGRLRGFHTIVQLFVWATSIGAGAMYLWMVFQGALPQSWSYFLQAHRWAFFVAASGFFFLIAAFSKFLRMPLSTNDRLIIVAFGLMIGGAAVGATLREIWGNEVYDVLLIVEPVISLITCGLGVLWFSRQGEFAEAGEPLIPIAETEILENLDAMNRTIEKTLRK